MLNRWRTRIAARFLLTRRGAFSGKNLRTRSSTARRPSATAKPTAVEVKLLVSEKSMCGISGP